MIIPLSISHGSATASDYHWTFSGPQYFIAQASSTRLQFVSNDGSGSSAGIFLDDISVVPALIGDYNGDDKVDAADYVVWRKTDSGNSQGYTDWRKNFGEGMGSGGGSAGASPSQNGVPEPATLVLLMFAAARWCLRRAGPNSECREFVNP